MLLLRSLHLVIERRGVWYRDEMTLLPKSHCWGQNSCPVWHRLESVSLALSQLKPCRINIWKTESYSNISGMWFLITHKQLSDTVSDLCVIFNYQLSIASWNTVSRACDTAQWVEVATTQPDDLGFIPRTCMVERGWYLWASLWPPHMFCGTRVHPSAYTYQINK